MTTFSFMRVLKKERGHQERRPHNFQLNWLGLLQFRANFLSRSGNFQEISGKTLVCLRNNNKLDVRVRPGTSRQNREAALHRWYRQLLRDQIPELIDKWGAVIGVNVAEWGIKKMKTRWGTCNIAARLDSGAVDEQKLGAEELERLRSLGYIQ